MTGAPFWRILRLAPTDDEALIRKAYAERLKQTNPEDDAEGFKALRAAYESALRHAEFRKWRVEREEESFEDAEYDDEIEVVSEPGAPLRPSFAADASAPDALAAPDSAGLTEPPSTPLAPEERARKETIAAHYRARTDLASALYDGASPWRLLEALEAFLLSQAMESVDIYADAERWLVNLIRDTRPNSDLMVERAIEFFGWGVTLAPRGEVSLAGDVWALLEDIRQDNAAHALLARVRDRRHEFHRAYKETMRPLGVRNWFSRLLSIRHWPLVRRFLNHLDDKAPMAVLELDADAVHWWRDRIRRFASVAPVIRWAGRVGAVLLFLIGLALVVNQFDPSANNPQAQARARCKSAASASVSRAPSGSGITPARIDAARVHGALLERRRRNCENALQLAPDSLMLMQYAGIVDLKSGAPNRAIERFRAISAISPADPFALYGEGLAQRMLGSPEAQGSLRQALKLDPSVEAYFAEFGVEVPTGLASADAEPSLIAPRPRPAIDTPPRRRAPLDQKVYDDAYRHFGITSPLEGNVVLECLARSRGAYSDCRILEEAPRNSGLGEMAIRVAGAIQVEPATLNGVAVDAVPIRVPFTFKLEERRRDP